MKTLLKTILSVCLAVAIAAPALAYDKQGTREDKSPRRGKRHQRGERKFKRRGMKLTEEQRKKAREIMKKAFQDAKDAETREEKMKIIKAARKKIREEVLTKEQRAKIDEMKKRRGKGRKCDKDKRRGKDRKCGKSDRRCRKGERKFGRRGIKFTEDQRKQAREIMKEAIKEAKNAKSREEKMKIFKAARKKIHEDVLTKEQRAKIGEMRKRRGKGNRRGEGRKCGKGNRKCGRGHKGMIKKIHDYLKLSKSQRKDAKQIMKGAFEAAKKAETKEEKMQIFKAARDKIFNEVLTENQQKKAKELRAKIEKQIREGKQRNKKRGHANFYGFLKKRFKALGLSKSQRKSAWSILKQAREAAKKADSKEARVEIMSKAIEKIRTDVLTEDQRKASDKFRAELKKRSECKRRRDHGRRDGKGHRREGRRRGRRGGRRHQGQEEKQSAENLD